MSDFERLRAQAARAWKEGNWAFAESCANAALRLQPKDPEAQRLLALALHCQGHSEAAVKRLNKALKVAPSNPLLHMNMGSILATLDRPEAAIEALQRACRLDPTRASTWYNLGKTLRAHAQDERALTALRKAVSLDPGHASAHAMLGDACKALGQTEEAAAAFRRSIEIRPVQGHAWWSLANLKVVAFTDAEVQILRNALEPEPDALEERIPMQFALAWALDQKGQHAEAFALLQRANAGQRSRMPWDREAFAIDVQRTVQAFQSLPPSAAAGEDVPGVIFVVSLPRSGSTLVEQILAAHPLVDAASELSDLPAVIAEESERRGRPFPLWVPDASQSDWARLGQRYLQRTRRWQHPSRSFTDKLPNNFLYVGAALHMLPQARAVGVTRNALETIWSCFQQYFARGQAFSYDLDDLLVYQQAFTRLDALWAERAPDRYVQIRYEAVVTDPEGQTRRLLDRLGLPFHEDTLAPHRAKRAVRTASASQVRQAIDQRGIGRTAAYAQLLAPWAERLSVPVDQ